MLFGAAATARLEAFADGAADLQFRTIPKDDDVIAVSVLSKFVDRVDVDDGGTMGADEAPAFQRSAERAEQGEVEVRVAVALSSAWRTAARDEINTGRKPTAPGD